MRASHASHFGPTCPKDTLPLIEHFIHAPRRSDRRAAVHNPRTSAVCFEVQIR